MREYSYLTEKNPSGYWSFNSEGSHNYKLDDVFSRNEMSTKIVRLSKGWQNWEKISELKNLEEIHLYSPSDEQLELISNLKGIKRLLISAYRPKTIAFLAKMTDLEELSLDAVSGFDDLSPIQKLSNLRALNLDLLRRVYDFGPLSRLNTLKFLRIVGNYDFNQPIQDFGFCRGLKKLEYLIIDDVRVLEKEHSASPLVHLESLKYIGMSTNVFPVEEYAFIAEALSGVKGAEKEPVVKYIQFSHGNKMWGESFPWQVPDEKVDHIDMHRPLSPPMRMASGVILALDGLTDIGIPSSKTGHMLLLGRGSRGFRSTVKNAEKRCLGHIEKYNLAKQKARSRLAQIEKH